MGRPVHQADAVGLAAARGAASTRARLVFGFATLGLLVLAPACGPGDAGGAGGSGGQAGSAGTAGAGGTTGRGGAGAGGTGGSAAGTTGAAGTSGSAGTSGAAGAAGNAGGAGTGAAGGSAGGSGGAAGSAGGAGTMGTAGRGGASGGGRGGNGGGGSGGSGGSGGASGRGGAAGGVGGAAGGAGSSPDGGASDGARDATGDSGTGYMPCPTTAGTACAVLPLGDSITEGYIPSGANGGYRVELFRQAVRANKNITFVGTQMNGPTTVENRTFPRRHEGRGGYTIAGGGQGALAGTVTNTALDMFHPNIVLLMIGTNDINGNINISTAPTRLGQLIDDIVARAPTALVVVASIIPIKGDTSQRIQTYNGAIPGLVATRAAAGKHVVFVDNNAAFVQDSSWASTLMADNLHPNEAGYAVLGRAFYGAISGQLPAGP